MKVYDNQFNANEWYFILLLILGIILMSKATKHVSYSKMILFYALGVYIVMVFDHTISIDPLNFYDVNDSAKYSFFDFISYLVFGPFSYIFLYLYSRYTISGYYIILFILGWSLTGTALEYIGVLAGAYHYRDGYKLLFSSLYMWECRV